MKSAIYLLVHEWRYAPHACAAGAVVILSVFYWASGSFTAEPPWYFSSRKEFLGMTLLMILIPAYIVTGLILAQRRSIDLAGQIDKSNPTQLNLEVRQYSVTSIAIFALLGWLYAVLFNIPGHGLNLLTVDSVERATILGQMLIWSLLGTLLAVRVNVARAFYRAGDKVTINIYETSNLKPFALTGLVDVLLIVGGLVLSTVQSLDFSFRPDNYTKALFVAVPSMIYLSCYPMWRIHQRMLESRSAELRNLNERISAAPCGLELDDMTRLETLLQRRERVLATATWPLDVGILQRFIFYIIIPPLAWVGAAVVESVIDGLFNT